MRIRNIITLLLLSLLATACNTDKGDAEGVVPTPVELVIRASQGVTTRASVVEDPEIVVGADLAADPVAPSTTSLDTRTELGDVGNGSSGSGQSIFWSVGDKLKLWAKSTEANAPYVMSGTTFTMATYNADFDSADFMATLSNPMAQNTYNYYGVYPEPADIFNTTNVSYTIPVSQNGAYNPALDVMTATTTGRELVHRTDMHPTIGTTEEPRLLFSHLFHLIRIHIPSGGNSLGSPIKRLILIFPSDVVGKVSFNVAQLGDSNFDITKTEYASWTETSNRIVIDLPDEQTLDANGRYVWLHVKPGVQSGPLRMRVCSENGVISQEASATINKTMHPQHITPISLNVPQSDESASKAVTFTCATNNLGEPATVLNVVNWPSSLSPIKGTPNALSATDNKGTFSASFYYLNTPEYQFNTESNNPTITAWLESSHVSFSDLVTTYQIPSLGASSTTTINYTLPHLLFEDFSNTTGGGDSNDAYAPSGTENNTNVDGVLLNQYGLNGWNASRFKLVSGQSIRIGVRYQSGAQFVGRYCGRLDTPALKRLKSAANISVKFDIGCYIPVGYAYQWYVLYGKEITLDDRNNNVVTCSVGYHTNADTSVLNGDNQNDVKNNFTQVATFGKYKNELTDSSFGVTFPHTNQSFTIPNAGSSTRVCWWALTDQNGSYTAANCHYYLYIDNIRISIAN